MPKIKVGKRRMTQYVGSFFMVLAISLTGTMVAIGYFSVVSTTREVLKRAEKVEKQKTEAQETTTSTTMPVLTKPATHLKDYNSELYEKSSRIFKLHNATIGPWVVYSNSGDLIMCNQSVTTETKLVLITTMPYSPLKEFIFNNTITNWSRLKPHVLPVLYIAKIDILENSGILIHRACSLGWVVAIAPTIITSGFPMLRHMLSYTASRWKAPWYGFSNGDILFTDKLVSTLDAVSTDPCLQRVEFLTSQRRNAVIPREKIVTSFEEVETLANQSELAYPNAIDLFIYKQSTILIYDMPDFVAGRRGFDNWLLYHVLDMGVPMLDITDVTPVVHQGIEGLTFWANSHQAKQEDDSFNIGLATGEWWYERGHLWCVPYLMQPVNHSVSTTNISPSDYKLAQAKFLAEMFDTNVYVFIRYFFSGTELSAIYDWSKKARDITQHQHYMFRNNGAGSHGKGSRDYMLVRRMNIPANCWSGLKVQLSSAGQRTHPSMVYHMSMLLVILFVLCRL